MITRSMSWQNGIVHRAIVCHHHLEATAAKDYVRFIRDRESNARIG